MPDRFANGSDGPLEREAGQSLVLEAAALIRTRREGRSKLHWFEGGPLKAIAERWPISTDERAFER